MQNCFKEFSHEYSIQTKNLFCYFYCITKKHLSKLPFLYFFDTFTSRLLNHDLFIFLFLNGDFLLSL